ncbi:MAG: hypothetical protein AAAB16_25340, partial [Pseudomonas sp.]|uniref:hypothetical protein n=1 Tax=Pseudomonas sp. TaxID=306 RepID=UPI0030F1A7E5
SLFTNEAANRNVSDAYAYAWSHDLYPVGNHGVDWHGPHKHCFEIGEEKVDELAKFLDDLNLKGETITFYELEDHFRISSGCVAHNWERMDLVFCCRYFCLLEWFGEDFWKGLVGHSNCPSESHSVRSGFDANEVYFE